jgi:hypothetical protein
MCYCGDCCKLVKSQMLGDRYDMRWFMCTNYEYVRQLWICEVGHSQVKMYICTHTHLIRVRLGVDPWMHFCTRAHTQWVWNHGHAHPWVRLSSLDLYVWTYTYTWSVYVCKFKYCNLYCCKGYYLKKQYLETIRWTIIFKASKTYVYKNFYYPSTFWNTNSIAIDIS